MKKYILSVLFTLALLLFGTFTASASTSSSVAYVEYLNRTETFYHHDVTIPSVTDENQDNVNIGTGDLQIKETDLYLPGKNGLDLEITRSFSSGELSEPYFYDGFNKYYVESAQYAYKYQDTDGNEEWFFFPSEQDMLDEGDFYSCPSCRDGKEYHAENYDGDYIGIIYKYYDKCRESHDNAKLFTRIPNQFTRAYVEDPSTDEPFLSRYAISNFGVAPYNKIFKTWKLDKPAHDMTLVDSYNTDTKKHREYYGEFFDGESIYSYELRLVTVKETDEETGTISVYHGDKYTGVFNPTDELTKEVFGEENIKDTLYFEDKDGIRYYFKRRLWAFVAKTDRFGNIIRFDLSTQTYTDTYGRKITANDEGITVNDGTQTYQVVKYENEHIPYEQDPCLTTLTPYKFHVTKYGTFGDETSAETTTYDMYLHQRSLFTYFSVDYYTISKITHPSGAETIYDFVEDKLDDPARDDGGNVTYVKRHNVGASSFKDGETISNLKEYTYPEPYHNINDDTYTVTVTKPFNNQEDVYTFNYAQRLIKHTSSSTPVKTEYEYDDSTVMSKAPVSLIKEKYETSSSKFRTRTWSYDERGNLLSERSDGPTISYTYGANGLLLTKTYKQDADTTILIRNTLSEDEKSIVRSETLENDVLKQVRTYEYDSFGNVTKETVADPQETETIVTTYSYVYNTNGTSSVTQTIKNLYDADGNPLSDITSVTHYDLFSNVSSVTDAMNNMTAFTYDARGRVLSETKPQNITTTYSYDAEENIVILTQPNGTQIKYEYDGFGKPKAISVNEGNGYRRVTSYTYDALSRLLTQTEYRTYAQDGTCTESYQTTYTYDKLDRETKRTTKDEENNLVYEKSTSYNYESINPYNTITQTVTGDANITPARLVSNYNLQGNLKSEIVMNGETEYSRSEYTYDNLNNVTVIKDNHAIDNGLDYTVKYEYDHMNNVVKETDINGSFKTTEYDSFGRATKVIDFGGTSVINYAYDDAGRLIKSTHPGDPASGMTAEEKSYYDANGNLIKVLTFAEWGKYQAVENEYDSLNRLTKVKTYPDLAPNGDTTGLTPDITQYTYDAMGNILTMSIGTTTPSVTTYAYNSLNQLTSKTDALGRAETYTYNLAGDMLTKTDRNGTSFSYSYDTWGNPLSVNAANGTKTQSVSYTYDILGNRLSMTDEHGTTTYTNDFLGRVTQESRTDFRGNIVNQYTYDKFGNVTQSNINGQITQNTFDNLNRITAQTSGNLTSSFSYNSVNKLGSKVLNGITSTYGYSDQGNPSSLNVINSSNQRYFGESILYNVRDNMYDFTVQMLDSSYNVYYYYDGKNRLKNTNGISETYIYDEKDNRINTVGDFIPTVADKTFDLNNRDSSATFDNNGNMIEDENGVIYEYDLFNRMVSVDAGIGAVFEYSYDGDGKRIRKTSLTEDVYFIWDGTNLAEQKEYYLGQLADSKKFIYGTDLSYCITDDDVWTYYTNIRGDIVGYVDSEGNAVEYKYDAWGNLLNPTEGDENPFRYAGEYFDAETGFIYLRNRYYDPSEGRFTQEDPYWNVDNMIYGDSLDEENPIADLSAIMQSGNLYVYCINNPVIYDDQMGTVANEKFSSTNEAAKDWAWNYFEASYYVGFERASIIYMNHDKGGNVYYSYTYAVWGEPHGVRPEDATKYLPKGATAVAIIHSHPNSAIFSETDKYYAKSRYQAIYLVSDGRNGANIKKYYDTRKSGYIESWVAINTPTKKLTTKAKDDLEITFAAKWKAHIQSGCSKGFMCENKSWPKG